VPGYLLWPWTWLPPPRGTVVNVLNALAAWLAAAEEGDAARSRLYRRMAGLRKVAEHAPFEPAAVSRRRAAWSDVVADIGEVAAAAAQPRQGGDRAALTAAAASVRQIAVNVEDRTRTPVAAVDGDELGQAIALLRRTTERNW